MTTIIKNFVGSFVGVLLALQVHAWLQQPNVQKPDEIITQTGTVEQTTGSVITGNVVKKPKIICRDVCNGYDNLVQYAYDISSGDMDFILTITHESKRNWKSQGAGSEDGICQWTDFWKEWKASQEFKNPYRQIDKCREQYQGWLAGGAIERQLVGYKYRLKRTNNFTIIYE